MGGIQLKSGPLSAKLASQVLSGDEACLARGRMEENRSRSATSLISKSCARALVILTHCASDWCRCNLILSLVPASVQRKQRLTLNPLAVDACALRTQLDPGPTTESLGHSTLYAGSLTLSRSPKTVRIGAIAEQDFSPFRACALQRALHSQSRCRERRSNSK